jgi:hypothetical protein
MELKQLIQSFNGHIMIIKNEVIKYLNKFLNLPASGHEQDWAVEMGDPNRVQEFIEVYKTGDFTNEQRFALVSLILASYEELLYREDDGGTLWKDIRQIILVNKELFKDILNHWGLENEAKQENWFKITPLIRDIR